MTFFNSFLISSSVEASTAERASSSINIFGFLTIARASAILWRCPPDNPYPRSPTLVSYVSGNCDINSCAFAIIAASSTFSCEASIEPIAILSLAEFENKKLSSKAN